MQKESSFNFSKPRRPKLINRFIGSLSIVLLLTSVVLNLQIMRKEYVNNNKQLLNMQRHVSEVLVDFKIIDEKIKQYNNILLEGKINDKLRTEIIAKYSTFFNNDVNFKFLFANSIISSLPLSEEKKVIYEKDRELFNILFHMYKTNPPQSQIANLQTQCVALMVCINDTQSYKGLEVSDEKIIKEKNNLKRLNNIYKTTVYNLEHIEDYQKWHKEILKSFINSDKKIEYSPGEKYVQSLL